MEQIGFGFQCRMHSVPNTSDYTDLRGFRALERHAPIRSCSALLWGMTSLGASSASPPLSARTDAGSSPPASIKFSSRTTCRYGMLGGPRDYKQSRNSSTLTTHSPAASSAGMLLLHGNCTPVSEGGCSVREPGDLTRMCCY